MQMLGLWAIVTFAFFINALALNMALTALFFFLTITFALLSGGVGGLAAEKVCTKLAFSIHLKSVQNVVFEANPICMFHLHTTPFTCIQI